MKTVFVETCAVKNTENNSSEIVLFDLLFDFADEIGFSVGFDQLGCLFLIGYDGGDTGLYLACIGRVGDERAGFVFDKTVLVFYSETLVLLLVDGDEELGSISHCFCAVPFAEEKNGLLVLDEVRDAAQSHFAVHSIALFQELQQYIQPFAV